MKTKRRNALKSASLSARVTTAATSVPALTNISNLANDKNSAEDRRVTTQEDEARVTLECLFYNKES